MLSGEIKNGWLWREDYYQYRSQTPEVVNKSLHFTELLHLF